MNDKMGLLSLRGRASVATGGLRAVAGVGLLLAMTSLTAVVLPVTVVHAQTGGATTAATAYKIGVDDQIEISVVDHADASRTYQVPSDGFIEPQIGGSINVLGMTVNDLRAKLTRAFAKRYYQPQVIVNVHPALQSVNAFIANHGGKFALKQGDHLLTIVAAAGGLPFPRPELYKGTLFRAGSGEAVPIDMTKLYANDPTQNVEIYNGDTIYIEEKDAAVTTIQVIGEVAHPGPIAAPRDESLITVMQDAGGPTLLAAVSRVDVVHNGVSTTVDMTNYRLTGKYRVNGVETTIKVDGGDSIIVPANKNEYYVTGAAQRTGTQIYPDDKKLDVFQAFNLSGGSTEGVDLHKVKLLHPLANNTTQTSLVDVQKMLDKGDFSNNPIVVPGDTVYIPTSSPRRGLSATEAIGLFTGIVGVFYTITLFRHH